MSNALAIAGVTAVIKDLIDSGLIDHKVTDALGAGVIVSTLAPDTIKLDAKKPSVNLFLHQVTSNAAYRNVDLPSRNHPGERTANPPLALDLHYLVTAYGVAELEAEVLLGYALQLLHETPVLGRAQIRTALNPSPVSGAILPTVYQALRGADLAEQVEMIKVTPSSLTTEEMSRLWSALQAHYRPTAAFKVSVVLIEPQRPAISPLPVLRRGDLDQGVFVQPDMRPPFPTLETILAPAHATPSVLRLGDAFEIRGQHLSGTQRALVFRNDRFGVEQTIGLPAGGEDNRITANVPMAPAGWLAGMYRVELRVTRPGTISPRHSNALPVAIAPAITSFTPTMSRSTANVLSIQLDCRPEVRPGQRASLLVDTREVPAAAHAASTAQLDFEMADAPPAGTRPLVRLRVDGIDSVAIDRTTRPPSFFDHRVTLPV